MSDDNIKKVINQCSPFVFSELCEQIISDAQKSGRDFTTVMASIRKPKFELIFEVNSKLLPQIRASQEFQQTGTLAGKAKGSFTVQGNILINLNSGSAIIGNDV